MATGTISIRSVEALAPGEVLWDRAVRGFGVRRQQDAASYIVKYRAAGRQRFLTIGPHGSPWTPERARREAKRLLGLVADGKDPADARAQAALQAVDTLGKIADQYLTYAKRTQRPRSYYETERYLRDSWKPLHPISVFDIRRRHVASALADIAAKHGNVAAIRSRAALSAMFNWAIREGLDIPANPVTGTNRPAEPRSRDRVLTDAELRAIWLALPDDDYGRIVRLLILTAQRRGEVGAMRWSELNGDTWTIPATRTKNHRGHSLPLTKTALALIEAQPRRNDRDFLFSKRGYTAWPQSKAALDGRIGGAVAPWRLHDVRRTAATVMADRLGVLPHIVEAILNHASGHRSGVAGVYNRARYAEDMRTALGRWADHVARIVSGRPTSITLHRVATVEALGLRHFEVLEDPN
jgi:integrase